LQSTIFVKQESIMTIHQYPELDDLMNHIEQDDMQGWCTVCADWTHPTCEPDASEYKCPECHNHTCYGAEELLLLGNYE